MTLKKDDGQQANLALILKLKKFVVQLQQQIKMLTIKQKRLEHEVRRLKDENEALKRRL